jgi:hypothetical protein
LALYLARIPAGLAIIVSLVAVGFTVVCVVCVFAAPTTVNYQGVEIPAGLSHAGFQTWAADHTTAVLCDFPTNGPIPSEVNCRNGPSGGETITGSGPGSGGQPTPPTLASLKAEAIQVANLNYSSYALIFRYPSNSLMIKSGLWIELEAVIGFIVGLGLASLLGQRTVPVILMIVLEIVLTPILARARIPHLSNLQRAVVGLATVHLEPGALPSMFGAGGGGGPGGGGGGGPGLLPESTTVAVCVIVAWLVGWTVIGAWRMMTRDA